MMQTPDRVRVIPLGTSAGRPTLSRAASALAIATDGAWILCDCGEGAQITALRAGLSLSRLDAVLVTHLHGDHFNGLPGLLGTLGLEGRERPIVVVGPPGIAGLRVSVQRLLAGNWLTIRRARLGEGGWFRLSRGLPSGMYRARTTATSSLLAAASPPVRVP